MTDPESKLQIDQLGAAFSTSFEWIMQRDRATPIAELALEWAELVASALQDVRLAGAPAVDHTQKFLPFIKTHKIKTELFHVAASGMRGGPWLDMILQIWFDTEHASGGFGVPLLMQRIPAIGTMPRAIWDELREAADRLNVATPSGRVILFRHGEDLTWDQLPHARTQPIVINSSSLASLRYPPRSHYARRLDLFCHDLASGWIGDPILSGREPSPVLDEIFSNFHVGRVLRIHIVMESD